uniref:Peptidyl-glycine alpha-amidating monooxygenase-like n=1 Tax=Saccoglossus kowalevskii TaxID=10224 RepID=A0ABM0LXE8_SACKO|nr:PREDICTED: peptidyl-glycine alpha-amidating monooxygenase-like [Saccoglossus kowalevskii]
MAVGFYLSLLMLLVLSAAAKKNDVSTDLLMPDVSPQVHDTYYCHPLKMPEEPMYITGFEPHAKKETAHHMLLFGCKTPGMRRNVWQPKLAGVYLMAAYGTIPNTGKEVYQEVACLYEDKPTMHPFAFRTHTHSLGTVVAGYRVTDIDGPNTEWTEIGRRNPQLPQMFYPIRKNIPISQGDVLAARCTMVNNLDHVVSTGTQFLCMRADDNTTVTALA